MKRYLLILMLIISTTSYAGFKELTIQGIIIVLMAEMNLPKKVIDSFNQQKTKGYYENPNDNVRDMISSSKDFKLEVNNTADPTDTHLKTDLSKVKLAFTYKKATFLNAYGYAVGGQYIKDQGWTAISAYFNDSVLGSFKYKINNMKLSQGAVRLAKETVRFDVNKNLQLFLLRGHRRQDLSIHLIGTIQHTIISLSVPTWITESQSAIRC